MKVVIPLCTKQSMSAKQQNLSSILHGHENCNFESANFDNLCLWPIPKFDGNTNISIIREIKDNHGIIKFSFVFCLYNVIHVSSIIYQF